MAGTIYNIASDRVRCALSPLGASIASVQAMDRRGRFIDVALAPKCLFDGTPDPFTAGRTIAPCCGRIREGRISIDGVPMTGVIQTDCRGTGKLTRFGYATLHAESESLLFSPGDTLQGHEFHYWDSTHPGDAFRAQKPQSTRGWDAVVATETL